MQDDFDMDALRVRLRDGLKEKGLSMRDVSLRSGNGAGYVSSVITEGKVPGVSNLASICKVAGLSLSYVMYGMNVSPETEEVMTALEENPERRKSILSLLRS